MANKRLEVGILVRLDNGAPPVVIGAVVDDALLSHALRAAIGAAERLWQCGDPARPNLDTPLSPTPTGRII